MSHLDSRAKLCRNTLCTMIRMNKNFPVLRLKFSLAAWVSRGLQKSPIALMMMIRTLSWLTANLLFFVCLFLHVHRTRFNKWRIKTVVTWLWNAIFLVDSCFAVQSLKFPENPLYTCIYFNQKSIQLHEMPGNSS